MRAVGTAIPRVLVVLLALGAALTGVVAPAHADDGGLLVSRSATGPFADQLPAPLFSEVGAVVPLDRARARFYVQNDTARQVRASVTAVRRGPANQLTDALTFSLRVGSEVATGTLPSSGQGCVVVATGPDLAPGEVQPVDVSFVVGDLAGQRGMEEEASVDLRVTLTEVAPGGPVGVCGESESTTPPDCDRDVVVTLVGSPSCVPTAVDAGILDRLGPLPDAGPVLGSSIVLVVLGAGVVLVAGRRGPRPGRHRA